MPAARRNRSTQPTLTRVDVPALVKAATASVRAELDATAPEGRLDAALQIVAAADRKLPALRRTRTAMAASLALHDGVRAVWAAAGIGPTRLAEIKRDALNGAPIVGLGKTKIAALAKECGVRHYDTATALRRLPAIATEVVTLEARAAAARAERDTIIKDMLDSGAITKAEASRLIGRTYSLVSHMLTRSATD